MLGREARNALQFGEGCHGPPGVFGLAIATLFLEISLGAGCGHLQSIGLGALHAGESQRCREQRRPGPVGHDVQPAHGNFASAEMMAERASMPRNTRRAASRRRCRPFMTWPPAMTHFGNSATAPA